MTDCLLTAHREKFLLRVDFDGPGGPLGSLESTLAVRGPEFLVKDASGAERFTAAHRSGLGLRVEFREGGLPVAVLRSSFFNLVNPRARIEGVAGGPWSVWKDFANNAVEFRIDGREILAMGAGTTTRGWNRTTEVRPVRIDPAADPLLALALATVVLHYV